MMAVPWLKAQDRFTYADYLTWQDIERWELIDGEAYMMSPTPTRKHQELSGELFRQFANYLIFKLNNEGEFGRPDMYGSRDKVSVPLLGDLEIDLAEVFS